jgi:hypothetical protein
MKNGSPSSDMVWASYLLSGGLYMSIPHQLHLTFFVNAGQIEAFIDACAELGGKATVIELPRGRVTTQPMFTKVVHAPDVKAARAEAHEYIKTLTGRFAFSARREKIEIPMECAPETFDPADAYFEWHGKVLHPDVKSLIPLCERYNAHLSRNAVKGEETSRFVTLRDHSRSNFNAHIDALINSLTENGCKFLKSKKEFCVFDSCTSLDAGWLRILGDK